MLAHSFGILEMWVWIPLKSGMKPHFHTEGDHSSVFAESGSELCSRSELCRSTVHYAKEKKPEEFGQDVD